MKISHYAIIACTFACISISTAAKAETWQYAGGNDKTRSYVEIADRIINKNRITAQTMSVYSTPIENDIYAVVIKSEYDCSVRDFRTLEYSYYDFDGEFMSKEPSETINEHKTAGAGSINESLMDIACAGGGGTTVSDPFDDAYMKFRS